MKDKAPKRATGEGIGRDHTKHERLMQGAKSYSSGEPEQWYTLSGIARENRQLVIESVERSD